MSLLLRWIHVLSAMTWLGGMLFIALVLVPMIRREDPALRRPGPKGRSILTHVITVSSG